MGDEEEQHIRLGNDFDADDNQEDTRVIPRESEEQQAWRD
jgi:hypothetical protein